MRKHQQRTNTYIQAKEQHDSESESNTPARYELNHPIPRRPCPKKIRFRITDKTFGNWIQFQFSSKDPSQSCRMTSDMRPAHDIRVRPSFTPGPNRVEEIARVRRDIQPLNPVRLVRKFDRCGLDDNFSRIPRLNPSFITDKSHRAGPQSSDVMRRPIAKRLLQKIQNQLHSVRVAADDILIGWFVFNRHCIVRVVGPLAKIEGVRSPIKQRTAGVKIPLTPPTTIHVFLVKRPPRGRSEPHVPIAHFGFRLRLGGQP